MPLQPDMAAFPLPDRKVTARCSRVRFLLGCLLGLLMATLWLRLGEPWEILADGRHYAAMARGETVPAPFASRLVAPALARLLPWDARANFACITLACLVLASGVLALVASGPVGGRGRGFVACLFWGVSFPFVYYGTTWVRADAPMLALLALAFLATRHRAPTIVVALLVVLGTLAHETMLILIPALALDRWLGGSLTGGARYRNGQLAGIGLAGLATAAVARIAVHTVPGDDISYATAPLQMLAHVLAYSGGPVKHGLRIYAACGPALLFAVAWLARRRAAPRDGMAFAGLFLCVVAATFLATDTLRVLALLFVPLAVYAGAFVEDLWHEKARVLALACLVVQIAYSVVVFGHLRTFEASRELNVAAAGLSALALALCLLGCIRLRRAAHSEQLNHR